MSKKISQNRYSRRWAMAIAVAALIALAFQGSRGLWEPDEGFYTNVAAGMESSGDFQVPRLNGELFLDKPPLHYWGIAAGLRWIGPGEWGARTAQALWFLATACMAGLLAGSMWGPAQGPETTLRYALMLGPFVAANVLTPDTPLTFCAAAAGLAAWKWTLASGRRARFLWAGGFGLALGLGILAKGPAMLIFAFPLVLYVLVCRGLRGLFAWDMVLATGLILALGGSWYGFIIYSIPGAFEYFLDCQVSGRLWSGHYNRNADTLGALRTYLPVLIFGTLPWSVGWLRQFFTLLASHSELWSRARAFWACGQPVGWAEAVTRHRRAIFLILTIVLPIATLVVARSRLPLYLLPVFPALAVAASVGRWRPRPLLLSLWIAGLLVLKLTAAGYPSDTDSRLFAEALERIGAAPGTAIVAVQDKHNGLAAYGYSDLRWLLVWQNDYPFFRPPLTLDETIAEIEERDRRGERQVFVVKTSLVREVEARVRSRLTGCARRAGPLGHTLLDCDPTPVIAQLGPSARSRQPGGP